MEYGLTRKEEVFTIVVETRNFSANELLTGLGLLNFDGI
jgi:hypothetical protein